jgi:uncharacterized membrane protein
MDRPRMEQRRFEVSPLIIALAGVMIAVVFVATRFIQVPIPSGYIHLGDIAIYTGAFLFGPIVVASAAPSVPCSLT